MWAARHTLLIRFTLPVLLGCVAGQVNAQRIEASAPTLDKSSFTQKPFTQSPCFTLEGGQATVDCERIARGIAHNINALRSFARELEEHQRFADAEAAYTLGLQTHPNHRDLLQGLIRARRGLRSVALLTRETSSAPVNAVYSTQNAPQQSINPLSTPVKAAPITVQSAPTVVKPAVSKIDAARFGRYRALVIGNERYKDFAKLRSPLSDARAIAAVLQRGYGFDVKVLENATRYELLSALSTLRKEATEQDNVLIYYAGHGHVDEVTGRGYWLPVDAEHDNVANWLSTTDISDTLAGLRAKHSMIIADSCFSSTLLRGQLTIAIDERQSLIEKVAARRSRTIMTSGGLEPVVDSGAGKHSVFAAALLDALSNNGEVIEAARLFVQIRDRVAAAATQTPQYAPLQSAGHQGGDFLFVPR